MDADERGSEIPESNWVAWLVFGAVFLLLVLNSNGATYYVAAAGDDAKAGTSEGAAWKTVARVNQVALAAGDQVRFRAGDRFEGAALTVNGSGTSAAPIVVTGYTPTASPALPGDPSQRPTLHALPAAGAKGTIQTFGRSWVMIVGLAVEALDGLDVAAGIHIERGTNITIDGCTVTGTADTATRGIRIYSSPGIVVRNCTVAGFMHGINLDCTAATNPGFGGLIEGNTITRCDRGAISDWDGVKVQTPNKVAVDMAGLILRGNDISGFLEDGIDLIYARGVTVEGNYVHDSAAIAGKTADNQTGIKSAESGCVIRGNRVVNIGTAAPGTNRQGIVAKGDGTTLEDNVVGWVGDYGYIVTAWSGSTLKKNTAMRAKTGLAVVMRPTAIPTPTPTPTPTPIPTPGAVVMEANNLDGTGKDFDGAAGGWVLAGWPTILRNTP